jgi:hypothetical protein
VSAWGRLIPRSLAVVQCNRVAPLLSPSLEYMLRHAVPPIVGFGMVFVFLLAERVRLRRLLERGRPGWRSPSWYVRASNVSIMMGLMFFGGSCLKGYRLFGDWRTGRTAGVEGAIVFGSQNLGDAASLPGSVGGVGFAMRPCFEAGRWCFPRWLRAPLRQGESLRIVYSTNGRENKIVEWERVANKP